MNLEDTSVGPGDGVTTARLDVLKALGDNTRYAIYLELARAPSPRSTAQVAQILELHSNTVRPHLERMREVGLLEVEVASGGGVGRRRSPDPDRRHSPTSRKAQGFSRRQAQWP